MRAASCVRSSPGGCGCGRPPNFNSSSTAVPSTARPFPTSWRAYMGATKAPEDLLRQIPEANRSPTTSHINPDGDAIGSELGLARLLRRLGKGAVVWNRDETPGVSPPPAGSGRLHTGAQP